ncbi:MAG: PEP-CTERM sorting domain-containing protein [Planctomycetota bacterium]
MHLKTTLTMATLTTFGMAGLTMTTSAGVIGNYQFDTPGDTEGWSVRNNISSLTADGDSLNGTALSNDPQLELNAAGLTTTTTWDTIVFRVLEVQDEDPAGVVSTFDPLGLNVTIDGTIFSSGFTAVDSGDDFFTVTLDISSLGSAALSNIRLDPIGGAGLSTNSQTNGNTFAIDFIQITQVPEPSALALMGLGGLVMMRRRR